MFHKIDFAKLDREQRRKERIVKLKQEVKKYEVDGTPYKVMYYIRRIDWNKEYHLVYVYFRLCFFDLIKELVDSW